MYSIFKPQELTMDETMELVSKGIKEFREPGMVPYEPQHVNYLELFQVVAHLERVIMEQTRCKKEGIELKDEDFYTPSWINTVNEYTNEYKITLDVCGPIYSDPAVHSIVSTQGACACTLLNELLHFKSPYPLPHTLRQKQTEHILTIPFAYSEFKLKPEHATQLLDWYAPSILLCQNIPEAITARPDVYLTLEWVWNKETHPPKRFKQYANVVEEALHKEHSDTSFTTGNDAFSLT